MFANQYFYNQHIRNAVVAFGSIFNNITIRRTDVSDTTIQNLKVPLHYAPKSKVLSRVTQVPDLQYDRGKVEITLPRMSFELMNLQYDSARRLPTTTRITVPLGEEQTLTTLVPAPYEIRFSTSIYAKNQTDGLQILEQILPYFGPDLNVTVVEKFLNIPQDLNIVLNSVEYNDLYEGDFSTRTMIIWDLSFSVKMNFYGYTGRAELIKKTIVDIFANEGEGTQHNSEAVDGSVWAEPVWAPNLWADVWVAGGNLTESNDPDGDWVLREYFTPLP